MRVAVLSALQAIVLAVLIVPVAYADDQGAASFDGLEKVKKSKADEAYVRPGVDFSTYKRFRIVEPEVAFAKNWERDVSRSSTRGGTGSRVTDSDIERIKAGMAEIFLEVFTQELEKAGFEIVEESAEDVMVLHPAIIDLFVTAPDLRSSPTRTTSYVASAGSARLYIEFHDSVTGQILARAVDFKRAREWGNFQWANSVSNRQEARTLVRRWATMLVDRLEEIHESK